MKKRNLFAVLLFVVIIVPISFAGSVKTKAKGSEMPANVKSIIDKSCFGCHNDNGKNQEAKDELNFSKYDGLTKIQKIGKLKAISKSVGEGEMPPKKFLEKNPDKKLSAIEIATLQDWVKQETKLLKN